MIPQATPSYHRLPPAHGQRPEELFAETSTQVKLEFLTYHRKEFQDKTERSRCSSGRELSTDLSVKVHRKKKLLSKPRVAMSFSKDLSVLTVAIHRISGGSGSQVTAPQCWEETVPSCGPER